MADDDGNSIRSKTKARADALLLNAKKLQSQAQIVPEAQKAATQSTTDGVQKTEPKTEQLFDTGASGETLRSMKENLSFISSILYTSKETYLGVHHNLISPVLRVVAPPFRFFTKRYARLWKRFAFYTDKNTEQRVFSRSRSSLVIALTVAGILALTPTQIGSAIRFVTVEPAKDAIMMSVSMRTETFYLNNAQEIDSENNVYSVRGCRVEGRCSEPDAAYFRVLPRLSHDFWKLITYGNPIYVPDHVVAPIAPGVNRCAVKYYGYRITSSWISRLLRSFEVYPVMLEASCTYLGGSEGRTEETPHNFQAIAPHL